MQARLRRLSCMLLVLLCLCAAVGVGTSEGAENLVYNGDFSLLDAQGLPEGWERDMWDTSMGVSLLYADENGYDGGCVAVVNAAPNDARFLQTLEVEPNTYYRFSCMVRVLECGDAGYGATISFDNSFTYSENVTDTQGEWRELEVYGRTGEEQHTLNLLLRLGGYSMTNTGCAYFDNVRMERVDVLPEGVEAVSVEDRYAAQEDVAFAQQEGDELPPSTEPVRHSETYLLLIFLAGVLALALVRRFGRIASSGINAKALLAIGMAAAFLVRIALGAGVAGYKTDINCFASWSERMLELGPAGFYEEGVFCDYPPGYMLLLYLPAALRRLFGLSLFSAGHLVLIKLIPIVCDMLSALLIVRAAKKWKLNERIAVVAALMYLFNPAVFIDSAAWGQIDSVFTLLLVICALGAAQGRLISALTAFAAAMLIKPQAMLFAPLGLFAIVFWCIREKKPRLWLKLFLGMLSALGTIYLLALVFTLSGAQSFTDALLRPIAWLFELYSETLGSYPYLTINALNIHQLFGNNWASIDRQVVWTSIAWAMFVLAYLYSALLVALSKRKDALLLAGAVLIALIFTFGPKIHERYIFPALLLLTLACVYTRDRRLMLVLTVMSLTTAMNELLVLQGGMGAGNYGHLSDAERWLNAPLSLLNVLNAIYLSYLAFDICVLGNVRRSVELKKKHVPEARDHRMHFSRRDALLMAIVTLLYSALAFTNLGSTTAPQSDWVASKEGERVVIDLGETRSFHMTYYGGICTTNFTVELSNDGENWTQPCYAKYNQGEIFRWLRFVPEDENGKTLWDNNSDRAMDSEVSLQRVDDSTHSSEPAVLRCASTNEAYPLQTARYLRLTACAGGLRLSELAFWDEENQLLPASIAAHKGAMEGFEGDAKLLLDEQDAAEHTPSYYNGTYFDEIYHPRTAYEMNNALNVYEWTHPPLGKDIMGLGIRIFGMTPFGWRFMGALMGVFMLPLMYLLAKQLTKSSKLAFIAMSLMALDAMHFTQTRIATIDSYAVFFIMLMYLFMIRYLQMDWRKVSLGRSFIPLALSGVSMGLGIATKWIGAYAGVGLAVLLFIKLIADIVTAGEERINCVIRTLWTLLFCVGAFVIVPALIYYFSYTSQLRYEGVSSVLDMLSPKRFKRVIGLQESMFSYHAGLSGDTHPFRSPWYQWPIIWWPMWYYSGAANVPQGMVSSISCMGNPAVWWTGLVSLLVILCLSAWRNRTPRAWLIALIGFASQFLPWVLVPRSTFIYHYFASIPFIILCSVLVLGEIRKKSSKGFIVTSIALLIVALLLFAAFYPLESGMPVSRNYAQYLRWFKWYNF